jgi:hypothetical protein
MMKETLEILWTRFDVVPSLVYVAVLKHINSDTFDFCNDLLNMH